MGSKRALRKAAKTTVKKPSPKRRRSGRNPASSSEQVVKLSRTGKRCNDKQAVSHTETSNNPTDQQTDQTAPRTGTPTGRASRAVEEVQEEGSQGVESLNQTSSSVPGPSAPAAKSTPTTKPKKTPHILRPASDLRRRKEQIMLQLSDRDLPATLHGLEKQQATLTGILTRTLLEKQNNAALLMGYNGSGKTALLRRVLWDLRQTYYPLGHSFAVVHLSGRLQTDDSFAMRAICQQLCLDLEVEREWNNSSSVSFLDNLLFLLDVLKQGADTNIPVFFVLEDFDLFALRPKQTLLYNLCDLLQNDRAHIAIVGLTCRLDAFQLLEKRIRSRISYRRIVFSHVNDDDVMRRIVEDGLNLPDGFPLPKADLDRHGAAVTALLGDRALRREFRCYLRLGLSVRWFKTVAALAVSRWRTLAEFPTVASFIQCFKDMNSDWALTSLKDCSVLQLCLLAAVTRLEHRKVNPVNFSLCYEEYAKFRRKGYTFARQVCLKTWETLLSSNLLRHVDEADISASLGQQQAKAKGKHLTAQTDLGSYAAEQFRMVVLCVTAEEFLDLLPQLNCPTWLEQWACKWVDIT